MAEKIISREEMILAASLQELPAQGISSEDRISVLSACRISDRTLSRYLKGEIGNQFIAKQILDIMRKRIKERKPSTAA